VITHIVNLPPDLSAELLKERIFRQFPSWTWSQRSRETNSWIWSEGYGIQRNEIYRWVCKACVMQNKPQITSFNAIGLQNSREHLWRAHRIGAPEGEKKGVAQIQSEEHTQPSIMTHFKLNPVQPRDQEIANAIIRSFDKQYL
jgi:hypothetical protein